MAWPPILVRYGEIGIKSRSVRTQFERRLVDRIEEQLVRRNVEAEVQRERGRVFVRAQQEDQERALDALRHTFGVVSASPAQEVAPTPDAVAEAALAIARERLPADGSFALRCKRSGSHTFSSLDVAKRTASVILDRLAEREPRVDLTSPDLEIQAEVREDHAFVFTRTVKGPGGLPLGSQGRVGVLVDGPRAAHAAWLIAKRGSALQFFTTDLEKAREWLSPLDSWVPQPRVHEVQGGSREEIFQALAPLLGRHNCQALVVADGLEGALRSKAIDAKAGVPVFRPLVGYEGERFRRLARDAELPEEVG